MPWCQLSDSERSSSHTSSAVGSPHAWPSRSAMPADDVGVRAGLARRVDGLADALHPPLGVGDRALVLAPVGGRGQHDVGHVGRRGAEDVLHDQVVEAFQQVPGVRGVGLRLGRVLPDAVQRLERALVHRVEHLRTGAGPASAGSTRPRPSRSGRGPRRRRGRSRRAASRDGAHVAAALHVVLPAQRHQAGAVAPDVPGEQREVDQREHVVGGVVVLGDAQRPADLGAVGGGVGVRELADQLGRRRR